MSKHNSSEARTTFNKLNNQVKAKLSKFRQSNLEQKFTDLRHFNQSCSKYWRTISKLQDNNSAQAQPSTLFADSVPYSDPKEIAEKFGSILFGPLTHIKDLPIYPESSITQETITQAEFARALKNCNKKSAPENDGISNQIIANSPSNIKALILKIFNFSLKLGYIPKSWKAAQIIMTLKKGKA